MIFIKCDRAAIQTIAKIKIERQGQDHQINKIADQTRRKRVPMLKVDTIGSDDVQEDAIEIQVIVYIDKDKRSFKNPYPKRNSKPYQNCKSKK